MPIFQSDPGLNLDDESFTPSHHVGKPKPGGDPQKGLGTTRGPQRSQATENQGAAAQRLAPAQSQGQRIAWCFPFVNFPFFQVGGGHFVGSQNRIALAEQFLGLAAQNFQIKNKLDLNGIPREGLPGFKPPGHNQRGGVSRRVKKADLQVEGRTARKRNTPAAVFGGFGGQRAGHDAAVGLDDRLTGQVQLELRQSASRGFQVKL
jgi:hypothetical protein